jgi:hypothetical protein
MNENRKAAASHYARTRKELAGALGYDVNHLTAAQELRLDNVVALKLVSDTMRAALLRGEDVDHRELLAVNDGLHKLLPRERDPVVDDDPFEGVDPHKHLEELVTRFFAAKAADRAEKADERLAAGLSAPFADLAAAQARIDELEGRLAEFEPGNDRLPKALPSPSAKVITPSISDITPPGEIAKVRVGMEPGPDDHKAYRRPPVIDGEVVKDKPAPPKRPPTTEEAARAVGLRKATHHEPWRQYVTGGDGGFFWGGDRGRSW